MTVIAFLPQLAMMYIAGGMTLLACGRRILVTLVDMAIITVGIPVFAGQPELGLVMIKACL